MTIHADWQNVTPCTWPQLRAHADEHSLRIYWHRAGKCYTAWCFYGDARFVAEFTAGHAHGVEFEAAYKLGARVPAIVPAGMSRAYRYIKSWGRE